MQHSESNRRRIPKTAKPVTPPPPPDAFERWESPELCAAAAQYCAGEIPPPPSMAWPEGGQWCRRCAILLAPQLDIHPGRLADILGEYKPPAPPVPAPDPETALAALMLEGHDWSAHADGEELAFRLERGLRLTKTQRLTVRRVMGGVRNDDRAGLLRGVMDWLCPNLTIPVWRVHRQHVTLRTPCRVEVLPAPVPLDIPHHTLKRQHVRLTEEETGRTLVFLHASACPAISRTRDRRAFTVRSIYPAGERWDEDTIGRNLKLLNDFMDPARRPGAAWARDLRMILLRSVMDAIRGAAGKSGARPPGVRPSAGPRTETL